MSTIQRLLIFMGAGTVVLLPRDFVELHAPLSMLALGAISAGALFAARAALGSRMSRRLIITLLAVLSLGATHGLAAGSAVVMLAILLMGLAAGSSANWPRLLAAVAIASSFSLTIEFVMSEHWWSNLLGDPYQVAFREDVFRSRGILGQALVSGDLTAICALSIMATSSTWRFPAIGRTLGGACLGASLIFTGSRSVLLIAGLFGLLGLAGWVKRRGRIPPWMILLSPLAALCLWGLQTTTQFSEQRALDFSVDANAASFTVRQSASGVMRHWWQECAGQPCSVTGYGYRSLQEFLRNTSASGFTTVDNQFVSIAWDLGLVGLLAFSCLAVYAGRRLWQSSFSTASIGLFLLIACGFFFDVFYTGPGILLLGLFFAAASTKDAGFDHEQPGSFRHTRRDRYLQP